MPGRHEAPQHVLLALHLLERDGLGVRHDAQQVEDARAAARSFTVCANSRRRPSSRAASLPRAA